MVDDLKENGEQIDYDSIIRFMVYLTYETAIDSEYGEYWNNNEDNRIDFLTNKDLYVLFKQYNFMNNRLNKILKLDTMEDVEKNEYLNESIHPENKYVFPRPDWGNLADIIDPNDEYRYWVDGVQAKIEKPYKKYIPVDKIRQDYDGEDMYDYDYSQFDGEINTPIDVVKYKDQYILMDGHHRAAYSKVNGLKTIKAYVYDADELEQLDESIAYAEMNDDMVVIHHDE